MSAYKNVILGSIVFVLLLGCVSESKRNETVTTDTGLQYEVLREGAGLTAKAGNEVMIKETVSYRNGQLVYSTGESGIKVTLGANQLIQGLDEGLTGMKETEMRKLIIPTSLSKRSEYPSIISPDSILVYEVELVKIVEK